MLQRRYPVFRVTDPVKNITEIYPWLNHFNHLARPAGIVILNGEASVWVYGKEFVAPPLVPNSEKPSGELVAFVHNFDHLVGNLIAP